MDLKKLLSSSSLGKSYGATWKGNASEGTKKMIGAEYGSKDKKVSTASLKSVDPHQMWWGILIIALVLLVLIGIMTGWGLWWWLSLLLWVGVSGFTWWQLSMKVVVMWQWWVAVVVMVVVSFGVMFLVEVDDDETDTSESTASESVADESDSGETTDDTTAYTYSDSALGQITASNQFVDLDDQTKTVSWWIQLTPTIYSEQPMESLVIKDLRYTNSLGDNVVVAHTNTSFRADYRPDLEISYTAEGDSRMNAPADHVALLGIKLHMDNAYTFNTNAAFAMSDAGIGPSRTFQYVGLNPADLENEISFTVVVTTESGDTREIGFTGKLDGQEMYDTGGVVLTDLVVEEK